MATKGHENEAIKVEGLSASLQKFKDDLIGIPNQSDVVYYTQEEADAYNALLTGALNSTDPLTAEEAAAYNEAVPLKVADNTLSEAESVAYNAQLTGALDSITPLTAEQASAYTEAFPDDQMEEGDILSEEQAEAYNAQLTGALDHTTPLTAEQAVAFNTAFPAKDAGDTLLAFQANAYNATLDGAIKAGDVKTPTVPKKVKDYVDAGLDGKVDKETGKGLSTNDYTDDDKTTLDGLSVLSPVVRGNRVTSNTAQWTMFASVDYPSVSRYDDIVLLVQGLGYYYGGEDTGCWIVECRTRYKNSKGPNDIGMTITELSPTGSTGLVQFGYYTDATEGKTYFGVHTSTRHHYIETIKLGGQNIEHLETRIVLTEEPTGWEPILITREYLTNGDISVLSSTDSQGTITHELQVGNVGYQINGGTITGIKMNGASKGTTGIVDLGTVITAHQDISGKQSKVAKLGSDTQPVYTSAAGTFAACDKYAGGTAVTLNGTSKAALTASFYAPTGAGTDGQVLVSNGSGAPSWGYPRVNQVVTRSSIKGAVTINANSGSLQILNMSGNVSSVVVSNAVAGDRIYALFVAGSAARTISVSHGGNYICANGEDVSQNVSANGFRQIVFSYNGTKFYVDWM